MERKNLVSVVTTGRERIHTLERCAISVQHQTYEPIEHILISDGCQSFFDQAQSIASRHPNVRVYMLPPPLELITYKPSREARAQNSGIEWAKGEFIAYLDDDNTYEPNHISSLVEMLCRDPSLGAAHSYRKLWNSDNTPYTLPLHPWAEPSLAMSIYQELCRLGVYISGTNLMRDRILANIDDKEVGVYTVDTSEWVFRRELKERFPFRTDFSPDEMAEKASSDAILCRTLHEAGIRFASSGEFSLNYFLGGFSTSGQPNWHISA